MCPSRFLLVALALVGCSQGDPAPAPGGDAGSSQDETEPLPAIDDPPVPKDPDEAAAPRLDAVTPNRATVGGVGPSIVVSGKNFVPRSIVQLDGAPLATSFVSETELRATIPSNTLAEVGTLRISVGTGPPGGGASKELAFDVENPIPRLTSLDPLSVVSGAGNTDLDVSGAGFVDGATILFGQTELEARATSATRLRARVPAGLLGQSGSIPVKVVNPKPGGGGSSPIAFTVSNPSASVQGVRPSAASVGGTTFELTVDGTGFVAGSIVLFNGVTLETTFEDSGRLVASVPATSLALAGDFPIAVRNPPPGGGVSAPVVFHVQYPLPSTASIAPSTIAAGSGPTEITVTGSGFFPTSEITLDGGPAATTYIDAKHLKASLGAARVAKASSISVRVVNPVPGGGSSRALGLTVANGAPRIASLNPSSVAAGSADRAITIHGSGFVSSSTVRSNGSLVTTRYVDGGQLTATIPANHLLNPGAVAITVTNPAPGGGTSPTAQLVIGCDTTGVSFALGPKGTVTTLRTNFNGNGLMSRWARAGSCTSAPLYTDVLQPGRYAVVQNTAGVPVTLSAWADCTNDGRGDAFLTFYRRPTYPANDHERLGCAFVVAEGASGVGGYSSPESGGSEYCPGLTKANGGGLQLGVCEKAVVHIQPFDVASSEYTPPPRIRLRPE